MKCPRCGAAVSTPPDAAGLFVCPACGTRLKRVQAAARPEASAAVRPEASPRSAPASESAAFDPDALLARLDPPANPTATLSPGTPLKAIARPDDGASARPDALAAILAELHSLRRTQAEILALLRARHPSPAADELPDEAPDAPEEGPGHPLAPPLRSRRRKTVLLIDDDESTRRLALAALERAEVPVRTAEDGNAGLAALARERSDVIVLELGVGGAMAGKDVINMIKATMEWVDIPIVLYTRLPVAGQKEARTVHGADEVVSKDSPGAAETLVAQIVALFRKG